MTDDIVKRLRKSAEDWRGGDFHALAKECDEAADEIERLRAALREVANADFLDFSLAPERSASAIARAALEQRP